LCESLQHRVGNEPIAVSIVVAGAAKRKQGQRVAMSLESAMDIDYGNLKICDYFQDLFAVLFDYTGQA
jgi:hypothetical protein